MAERSWRDGGVGISQSGGTWQMKERKRSRMMSFWVKFEYQNCGAAGLQILFYLKGKMSYKRQFSAQGGCLFSLLLS